MAFITPAVMKQRLANFNPYVPQKLDICYNPKYPGVYLPPPVLAGGALSLDPKHIDFFNKTFGTNLPKFTGEIGYSRVILNNERHIHFLTNEIMYAYGYPYYSNRYTKLLCGRESSQGLILETFYEGTVQYDMKKDSCIVCNMCRHMVHNLKRGIYLME